MKESLLFANDRFYSAFVAGDLAALDRLWARNDPVVCIHPGWNALTRRDEIMASFKSILEGPAPPQIEHRAPLALLFDDVGMVVCYEVIGALVLVATNTFRRTGSDWHMIAHQAGATHAPTPTPKKASPPSIN